MSCVPANEVAGYRATSSSDTPVPQPRGGEWSKAVATGLGSASGVLSQLGSELFFLGAVVTRVAHRLQSPEIAPAADGDVSGGKTGSEENANMRVFISTRPGFALRPVSRRASPKFLLLNR